MAYHFQLPIITDLTIPQQVVLNELKAISFSGGPGTGKSVVSIWKHIQNYDLESRKSLLLTYSIALQSYFKFAIKSIKSDNIKDESILKASEATNTTLNWTYNCRNNNFGEIIVDEAQDVPLAVYRILVGVTKLLSYGIDPNQSMHLSAVQLNELTEGLPNLVPNNRFIPPLNENFRNTKEITTFVRSVFPNIIFPHGNLSGSKPTLICSNNNDTTQEKIILDIIKEFGSETHNIAILTPLVNPALHRRKVVKNYYNIVKDSGKDCSYYENQRGNLPDISNIHITTLKSIKGLEFDTVIIPDFNHFKEDIEHLYTVDESHYYVAFTRAKRNLMLIDNSQIGANNKCNLVFLQSQIQNNIITVDYDYLSNTSNDDLPF